MRLDPSHRALSFVRRRFAGASLLLVAIQVACGGSASPSSPAEDDVGNGSRPKLAVRWDTSYRFPLPDPGGPNIDLGALVASWGGAEVGAPLAEALDLWLQTAIPEELSRFLAAWNGLGSGALEIELRGEVELDLEASWGLESSTSARLWAACPDGPAELELSPASARDLGVAIDGWGPFRYAVETASGTVRLRAGREGELDAAVIRRLRGRAAVACVTGAPAPVSELLARAVPCGELAAELGPLAEIAERLCAEGWQRVEAWLEGRGTDRARFELLIEGVGFGDPVDRFMGEGGAGLRAVRDRWMARGSWRWDRADAD